MLQRTTTRTYRVAHLFCDIGTDATGFNQANPRQASNGLDAA